MHGRSNDSASDSDYVRDGLFHASYLRTVNFLIFADANFKGGIDFLPHLWQNQPR
jgi:hypothetical protein